MKWSYYVLWRLFPDIKISHTIALGFQVTMNQSHILSCCHTHSCTKSVSMWQLKYSPTNLLMWLTFTKNYSVQLLAISKKEI